MSAIGGHFFGREALQRAADFMDMDPAIIISGTRDPVICEVRFAMMAAMRERNMSLSQIGRRLGRDHTTIIHGLRRAEALKSEPRFNELVRAIAA